MITSFNPERRLGAKVSDALHKTVMLSSQPLPLALPSVNGSPREIDDDYVRRELNLNQTTSLFRGSCSMLRTLPDAETGDRDADNGKSIAVDIAIRSSILVCERALSLSPGISARLLDFGRHGISD